MRFRPASGRALSRTVLSVSFGRSGLSLSPVALLHVVFMRRRTLLTPGLFPTGGRAVLLPAITPAAEQEPPPALSPSAANQPQDLHGPRWHRPGELDERRGSVVPRRPGYVWVPCDPTWGPGASFSGSPSFSRALACTQKRIGAPFLDEIRSIDARRTGLRQGAELENHEGDFGQTKGKGKGS